MTAVATETIYRARRGYHISQEDAAIVGKEFERIATVRGQQLAPAVVVEEARSPLSPLHKQFQWDDTLAAEQYRLAQARHLLRAIEIQVLVQPDPAKPREIRFIPAFHHINTGTEEIPEGNYVHINVIRTKPDYVRQMVENARKELVGWQERYRDYAEVAGFQRSYQRVIEAIEAVNLDAAT